MINLKVLRRVLKNEFGLTDKNITIKHKKKIGLVETANGDIKTKRVNCVKIEIIEGGKKEGESKSK